MIDMDAIQYSLGVVLLQQQQVRSYQRSEINKENGKEADTTSKQLVTIGYWYKTLIADENNYSTSERECLSAELVKQVPNDLQRCTKNGREYAELDDGIPTLEENTLAMKRAQDQAHLTFDYEEEQLDVYDAMEEIIAEKI